MRKFENIILDCLKTGVEFLNSFPTRQSGEFCIMLFRIFSVMACTRDVSVKRNQQPAVSGNWRRDIITVFYEKIPRYKFIIYGKRRLGKT
jgi:hypothetical protein